MLVVQLEMPGSLSIVSSFWGFGLQATAKKRVPIVSHGCWEADATCPSFGLGPQTPRNTPPWQPRKSATLDKSSCRLLFVWFLVVCSFRCFVCFWFLVVFGVLPFFSPSRGAGSAMFIFFPFWVVRLRNALTREKRWKLGDRGDR